MKILNRLFKLNDGLIDNSVHNLITLNRTVSRATKIYYPEGLQYIARN